MYMLNTDIGNIEIAPRKPQVTQRMNNKMEKDEKNPKHKKIEGPIIN